MKNSVKRAAALVLALAMMAGTTACSGGESGSQPAAGSAQGSSQGGEASAAARTDDDSQEVTLTAFVMQSTASTSGIWDDWLSKIVKDELNMKIDFYPTGQSVEQKMQSYMAGGDLPDIVGFKGLEAAQNAINANMIVPLNEYKDLMPNIFDSKTYDDAVRYYEKYESNDTGNLYIVPTGVGPAGATDPNWSTLLQWSLYKQIGKPEINTLEDFLDVGEQMQKLKPTTDQGEKTYAFSLFSSWDAVSALQVSTLSFLYGIDTEYVSPLMETNLIDRTTKSLLADDSFYKRALKFYYTANQRGILDPDSLTQTYETCVEKYTAGRTLFSHFSWFVGDYNTPNAGHVTNEADPDGMAPVYAKDFKIYDAPVATIGKQWFFAISNNCANKERAAKFLNWFYDPQTSSLIANGPEGLLWEKKDNECKMTETGWDVAKNKGEMPLEGGGTLEDPGKMFNSPPITGGSLNEATGFTSTYRYWPDWINSNITPLRKEQNEFLGASTPMEYLKNNNMLTASTQAVNMVATPSDDLKMTISQIGEVIKTNSWKMIYAKDEAEFESLWTAMQNDAKGLGIDQVTEFYTTAWADALEKVKDFE